MRLVFKLSAAVLLAVAVGGCGMIYKPSVQQGNVLTKKDVDQLEPGLSKTQVLALLGQPSVTSLFDQDRWDYMATNQRRGGKIERKSLTLYFENDVLVRTEGEFFAEDTSKMLEQNKGYPTIIDESDETAPQAPPPGAPQDGTDTTTPMPIPGTSGDD